MNTITRRTALAGAAALPLLPVLAFALPAERNPVVAAFREAESSFDYDACRWARDMDIPLDPEYKLHRACAGERRGLLQQRIYLDHELVMGCYTPPPGLTPIAQSSVL